MKEMLSESLFTPVLPVRDIVVFPNVVVPLFVGRQISINAIKSLESKNIILVTQRDSNVDNPREVDLFSVGVFCRIIQIVQLSDDGYMIAVEAMHRINITGWLYDGSLLRASCTRLETIFPENQNKLEAHMQTLIKSFEEYASIQPRYPGELLDSLNSSQDKEKVVNLISANLPIKVLHKQNLLEEPNIQKQCDMLVEHVESEKYISELERRIRARIKQQVEQTQKEVLREQVNAIQRELNEDEDELASMEKKLKELNLTQEAREKCDVELKRLKLMNPMSAEASILRSYLECIVDLPWGKMAPVSSNLLKAEEILNQHHYGLDKTKERIYEFIAVQGRVDKLRGPVLCLFGPPGVGKTSLAKSIAEAIGRPFVRIALGGMRDEAEIRGHRRTYVGAMPGKIIQGMRTAKFCNPLILLDEIGNIGKDWRGDPESALLEVLDPEQNSDFRDHYLEIGYDLSSAVFIATTNYLNTMHPALQDRFEIINMPGYTPTEKFHIAKRYLIPKQLDNNGLKENELSISDSAVHKLITDYTREAGVRSLDRELANLARKSLRKIEISNQEKPETEHTISVDESNLKDFAGIPKYLDSATDKEGMIGVVSGLAWTEMGGDILYIETVVMTGTGQLIITGKLGDVMQESAKAALSLIRSKAADYQIEPDFFKTHDIHLHVPAGAIPKDGPSAGITIFCSLLSAITKKKIRPDTAMTGELTLRGRVLPIGGLKEKSLAAHRANLEYIIIPEENEKDIEDIPTEVKESVKIISVKTVDDVLQHIFA